MTAGEPRDFGAMPCVSRETNVRFGRADFRAAGRLIFCPIQLKSAHKKSPSIKNRRAFTVTGDTGVEPVECQSQSLVPYHLANPHQRTNFIITEAKG